jgi:hypothetical protein
MLSISILMILIIYVFGADILLIYGQQYAAGSNILLIVIVTQCVTITGCLASPALLYMPKNLLVATSSILGIAYAVMFSVIIVFFLKLICL